MSISPRFLDDIRGRLTLSEVIGRRIKVTRTGREHKACCPFHKEKTPSFTINDQKQFYHCFGCGAHGDVIGFTMQHDNLSFVEAVEALAAQAGLQMPKPDPAFIEKEKKAKDLYDVVEAVCAWFQTQLVNGAHHDILEYVIGRGISQESIAAFRIGYAPNDGDALRQHMIGLGYNDKDMIEAGVLRASTKGGNPYSFFRDRVMFPVSDRRGRIVAFGGRVLPDHMRPPQRSDFTPPKYINSSDTPLFHKGRMLFGESQARQASRDGHTPIVVEGYLDVIACHQAGLKGAVAPLGTAMTEDQIMSLWSMIPRDEKVPVLCFDGDNAGRRAAERACERMLPLLKPDHSAVLAFLPDGEDPDSFLQLHGKKALVEHLKNAQSLSDFLWSTTLEGKSFKTPESRAGLEKSLHDIANKVQDSAVQGHYRNALKDKMYQFFRTEKQQAFQSGYKNSRKGKMVPSVMLGKPVSKQKMWVVLAIIINHPFLLLDYAGVLENISSDDDNMMQLLDSILSWNDEMQGNGEKILDFERLKDHLEHNGLSEFINNILNSGVYSHASFSRPDASQEEARQGIQEMICRIENDQLEDDLKQAMATFRRDFSVESDARVKEIQRLLSQGREKLSSYLVE